MNVARCEFTYCTWEKPNVWHYQVVLAHRARDAFEVYNFMKVKQDGKLKGSSSHFSCPRLVVLKGQ